ncbi:Iguana/Dzip1-like DAZ-interacting protein N-terminal [Phytophthora infestans]|uniref:Iguana/Dzip1-like DAZ-interacting protein N-terminal n=1 Tax=Phytophthora infestans TaxID=4787 RepID=A0A833WKV2_PHYIN|nr:Iguana/Dzip1-like DAZ-interacting protein N-terminal [Phytophthora infestans]
MGSYYMEDSRRYSGYDEYAGIFGPLQASSSSSFRSRGRVAPRRRGFSGSRYADTFSKPHKGRGSATREFNDRARFLAKRKVKRALEPLEGDSDGADDLENKENEPTSPTHGLQRQVWLPTRKFAFRQRAGKLDTRAIARLDLEKIAASTDIETIQRHLENLAFSDVTLDDVQHYSDAYFLKLFQIAQLTLEYLMHVQDSLVDHSEGLEKQCEQLLTECQELETENGQHETEIASLKREIRQKQRTMATLELMLLNASASSRMSASAKENASKEANAIVDELLADSTATEEGSIANGKLRFQRCLVCCVESGFYLRNICSVISRDDIKTQRRRKKKKSSSSSSSDSDSKKKKKKPEKPVPLPKEILDALEEKNQLAKQLMALQDQVRIDQETRERQRQQLENQQQQMNSRVELYMEKLQTTLVEIDKKQEDTKQDLRQYTHEAINRLQLEAANAELMRLQTQKASRAGRLENDDDEAAKSEAKWSKKVEKMMDTFLRAQAQKQQEIDSLEQESSKLWAKYNKLKKKKHRPEPTIRLEDLTALEAGRFGVDRGEVEQPHAHTPAARLEDKRIQTDEEEEEKRESKVEMRCEEVQTEAEPKVAAVVVRRIRMEASTRSISPLPVKKSPAPAPKKEVVVIPPVYEEKEAKAVDPRAKFQQAAHVIGKVALGFLTRRALRKTSNWQITIEISSLETALTAPELEFVRQHYDSRLRVHVEETMTASNLRVTIAKILSGKDEFNTENNDSEDLEITATMTYHRVLLHHKQSGVELSGDMLIHKLQNLIEVEIIPYHEVAAMQVEQVIETHASVSNRIEDIKRASMEFSASELSNLQYESDTRSKDATLARVVRLQALVRGFLAKKNVELLKIDRLVDARLVKMRTTASTENFTLEPSWVSRDPVLATEYDKVLRRLEQILRESLHREGASDDDLTLLSEAEFKTHSANLLSEKMGLSSDAQRRILLVTERLPPVATVEYSRRQVEGKHGTKTRTAGAAKIHRSVQVEVVRKRLKRLVADVSAQKSKLDSTTDINTPEYSATTKLLLTSWLSPARESQPATDKSLGSFDPNEIDQLANAYEEGTSPIDIQRAEEKELEPPATEEKLQMPLPLTPRMGPDDVEAVSEEKPTPYTDVAEPGRSPRPHSGVHVISPFSKTPLISRRAAARRGTGSDNAR